MVVGLNNLCSPAYFYLVISMLAIVIMGFQNMGNESVYCLGSYSCNVSSATLIFIIKIIYVLFWTWLLNIICKSGFTSIAWFLVLLPIEVIFWIVNGFSISTIKIEEIRIKSKIKGNNTKNQAILVNPDLQIIFKSQVQNNT